MAAPWANHQGRLHWKGRWIQGEGFLVYSPWNSVWLKLHSGLSRSCGVLQQHLKKITQIRRRKRERQSLAVEWESPACKYLAPSQ